MKVANQLKKGQLINLAIGLLVIVTGFALLFLKMGGVLDSGPVGWYTVAAGLVWYGAARFLIWFDQVSED